VSVHELINELDVLGIRLWLEDGKLRYRAPTGVMTEARRGALAARRGELLEYLHDTTLPTLVPDPAARHEPFPLTDVQAAYLLGRHTSFDYGAVGCQAYLEIEFDDLDPRRFGEAWRTLIRRHEMLRAVVHPDGHQRVLPVVPEYVIDVTDVRGAGAARVAEVLAATRDELSHRVHDPAEWPLFELRVTRSDARTVLHVSLDLLIADFVSFGSLMDEAVARYRDPEIDTSPPSITFRDYVLAERRTREGPTYRRDRAYWLARVDDLAGAPELPLRPAGAGPDDAPVRFDRWNTRLEPAEWERLRRAAAARGVTASGAVLAAYAEVVARWSRRPRFTLDLTLLNRLPLHPEVGSLMGDFTSLSLLEVEADPDVGFAERALALQRRLWDDLDHRLFSGVEVVREIARRRGRGAALMPIVYTSTIGLTGEEAGAPSADGPNGTLVSGITQTPQVWIDCQAMEQDGGLSLNWDVRRGIFPDGLVDDMFGALSELLTRLRTREETWLDPVPVPLPPAQLERRHHVNDTAVPGTEDLLHEAVWARTRDCPERDAVLTADRRLTYAGLAEAAAALGAALQACGTRPGDRVAVRMDKGVEQVTAVLGVLSVGAVYVPIDTNQPARRAADIMGAAGIRHVLTQSWLRPTTGRPPGVADIAVDELEPMPAPATPTRHVGPDDLAYVIYTSGSTGHPKGVMISHRAALNTVRDIDRRFGVGPADRVLGLAQLGFDLSVYDVFGPLSVGAAVVLPDAGRRADPAHWAELAQRYDVSIWNSVPAQMQMLDHYLAAEPGAELPALRMVMLSGDWIPVGLPDSIRRRLPGVRVVSLGGATEASIWSVAYPIGDVDPSWPSIPYGVPLANQTLHVLDAALRPCPDWATGELHIGGVGVAMGYLGDAERTDERFLTHPVTGERLYRTGDLARWLPDGNAEFLGREDDQVKIRGHRIELAEVVAALEGHPAVGAAAVVVGGDTPLERRLAAFVEGARRGDAGPAGGVGASDLARTAEHTGREVLEGADPAGLVELADRLDAVALQCMLRALQSMGLLAAAPGRRPAPGGGPVAPRHARLLRRWYAALGRAGLVTGDAVTGPVDTSDTAITRAWLEVERLCARVDYSAELVDYFRRCCEQLPALLRGEQDPVALLFPGGSPDTAWSAYNDNLAVRYTNRVVARWVADIADATDERPRPGPLRVLEVGAGVGGTTAEVLPALGDRAVDYTFTDISAFYLGRAEERFGDRAGFRVGRFDVDEDHRAQGFSPNSFDVIVCGDVLHAARHAGRALAGLRELLVPGGRILFTEATREHHEALTSLEFMIRLDPDAGDFEDLRRGLDQTFLTTEQWTRLLAEAGADEQVVVPHDGEDMATVGIRAFAARFKSAAVAPDPGDLAAHLAERLPEYMVPPQIEVVDAIPLTDNGKVDHRVLRSWLARAPEPAGTTDEEPADELERELAGIWRAALRVDRVGRSIDFFALGGDSLLAAQIAGRIRDEVSFGGEVRFDDLLRHMLEGPTVAELATTLTVPVGASTDGVREIPGEACALVALGATTGAGPLRLLVHDGTGLLVGYRALARKLAGTAPVVGLGIGDTNAFLAIPAESVPARMAAGYVRLLDGSDGAGAQRAQAIDVVGCGPGGPVAAELARQLGESGRDVVGLTLVGHPAPGVPGAEPADVGPLVAGALDVPAEEGPAGTAPPWRTELAAELAELVPEADLGVDDLVARYDHSLRAAVAYRPDPYAGDVTLVLPGGAATDSGAADPGPADPTNLWDGACLGTLRVVRPGAEAHELLAPPAVDDLTAVLLAAPGDR